MYKLFHIRATVGTWLFAMVLLVLVPILGFSIFAVTRLGEQNQAYVMANLERRAQATANVVGQRVQLVVGTLNAIATSSEATQNNLRGLYDNAQRAVRSDPLFSAITLVDAEDRMVFFTLLPFGAPMPTPGQLEVHHRLMQTGETVMTGPFKSPIADRTVATVSVPVFQKGKVAYGLRMVMRTESVSGLLTGEHLPPNWIAAVVAGDGRLLARSHRADEFVGQLAVQGVRDAISRTDGRSFVTTSKEGIVTRTVVHPIAGTDWSLVLGVPIASLDEPLAKQMMNLYKVGALLLLLSMAAAYAFSRVIRREIGSLVFGAAQAQKGVEVQPSNYRIVELFQADVALRDLRQKELGAQEALVEARNDSLTGLFGRSRFEDEMLRIGARLQAQPNGQLALFFIDIDNFKQVNDRLGHAQGDWVLCRVAEVLRGAVRETDIAARLGGDEFAICITGSQQLQVTAQALAERLLPSIAQIGHGIGCSIGIALCSASCTDLPALLGRADQAMYEAKRQGKNRYVMSLPPAEHGP